MPSAFEEIGYEKTPLGALSLRRRIISSLAREVYEVKLGDEYLMSSLFTDSERELGRLGIESARRWTQSTAKQPEPQRTSGTSHDAEGAELDVVVGGLGLGYTAEAVLQFTQVRSLIVVDLFQAVIDWHIEGIVPIGRTVSADPRCTILRDDFFSLALSSEGFDRLSPGREFHAILLDIDHTPDMLLDPASAPFYTEKGLSCVCRHLCPGGVFGLWSDTRPDKAFADRLSAVFDHVGVHPVTFDNPLQGRTYTQSVYIAKRSGFVYQSQNRVARRSVETNG